MAKQRKRRLKPYEQVAFTNDLGHVINPGDGIIAVTKCTGSVNVNVGRYLGLRRHKGWRDQEEFSVVVEYDLVDEYFAHKVTGERWAWNYQPPGLERPGHYPYQRYPEMARLPWNATPEQRKQAQDDYTKARAESDAKHKEEVAAYQVKVKAWSDAVDAHKTANYEEVQKPYTRCKTLFCNRIYPINMQMKELAKK